MMTVRSVASPHEGFAQPLVEAGALAVALGHGMAAAGAHVALIDADAWGTRLAQRIAAACRIELSPAQRGLPTLIAARCGLGPDTIREHCWTLPPRRRSSGEVLLAAAPAHEAGAQFSAGWLADRCGQLAALGHRLAVVVPLPGAPAAPYGALEAAASVRVHAVAQRGTAAPGGLRGVLAAFGLSSPPDPVIGLGCADGGDAELLGRIGSASERVLLGARPRRAERIALSTIDAASRRLLAGGLR